MERPLPVIALCLLVLMWGCGHFSMSGYDFAVPFFGRLLTGAAAGGWIPLICSGVSIWLGIGLYRLRPLSWRGLSYMVIFLRMGMMDYYAHMGIPEAQLKMMSGIRLR